MRIKGGPNLKIRLSDVAAGSPELVRAWADDAAKRMRATAPNARRPASRTWTPKASGKRAAVYGAFWWVFVDRGAKAHNILGSGGKNPPTTLKFSFKGRTIFAKSVQRGRMRRRPFITKAAQDALASSRLADSIVKQWNRRKIGSRKAFL